ncbi:hypothetical protein JCM5353_004519 [Sporobolomyces roseus]
MSDSLSVVLLNAEGDQFNASLIADGEQGGQQASIHLYHRVKASLARSGIPTSSSLVVYLVADRKKSLSIPQSRVTSFLTGFASTENNCYVVEPIPSASRIKQLLDLYLPLSSTSSILLASLHNNDLYPYLLSLPIDLKLKITFLSTVTIAPSYRHLSNEGWFKTSREFEDLFGGLLSPDVAARIWDIGQLEKEAETIEIEVGKVQNWVHQSFASEEDQIVASTSRHSPIASGLIWDAPSDDEVENPPSQHFAYKSPSPQPSRSTPLPRAPSPPCIELDYAQEDFAEVLDAEYSTAMVPFVPPSTPPLPPQAALATPPHMTSTPPSGPAGKKASRAAASNVETITQTPQGPVSSLPAFSTPFLSFRSNTQPCKRHYCAPTGCPQTAQSCRFSHNFPFTPKERDLFPLWVKSTVCMDASRGKCKKGDSKCIQGHRCPFTFKACPWGTTCKFKEKGMPHSSRV